MNGQQLYGLRRLLGDLKLSFHPELKGMSLKQKLALGYVAKQSKQTLLDGKVYSNTFTPYRPSQAYDRFLNGIKRLSRGQPTPVVTNFAVTTRCCCNCWHCSFADRAKTDRLDTETLKKTISQAQDLGASVIGITGGEPLLRADLEEIIASIGPRSMPLLFTTGFKLTPQRARALKQAGLAIPVLSLDHYTAERHDRGRRRKGMFEYALKAIEMFQAEGFYVAVSFVPDKELVSDVDDLNKTIDFIRDLGVNDMRLTSPILSGHLTAKDQDLLSPENVATIWDIQKLCTSTPGYPGVFAYDYFESDKFYGCGAGYNYMFIDASGNLCPCDFTMMSLGNVLERPMAEIWEDTHRLFKRPGMSCYANKVSGHLAARKPDTWPVDAETTRAVVEECPPYDPEKLPEFFRRLGIGG